MVLTHHLYIKLDGQIYYMTWYRKCEAYVGGQSHVLLGISRAKEETNLQPKDCSIMDTLFLLFLA